MRFRSFTSSSSPSSFPYWNTGTLRTVITSTSNYNMMMRMNRYSTSSQPSSSLPSSTSSSSASTNPSSKSPLRKRKFMRTFLRLGVAVVGLGVFTFYQVYINYPLHMAVFGDEQHMITAIRHANGKMDTKLPQLPMDVTSMMLGQPGMTPLGLAIMTNEYNHVRLLLDHGASPHATVPNPNDANIGTPPLTLACMKNNFDMRIVDALLAHGADPNFKGEVPYSALLVAMYNGKREAVKTLIPITSVDLSLAISCAIQFDQLEFLEALKHAGASFGVLEDEAKEKLTPLHLAVSMNKPDAVRELRRLAVVDTNALSADGKTALQMARDNGYEECANELSSSRSNTKSSSSSRGWFAK
eukprot:TRINITY_DN8175_c0_g2_i1.p1 TRINITY_DN8175_c0_g2~~TRINITY_DN8175_c0_g2_i1.p1  ORF type:complete len:403 (+),score=86.48 TRINITY_DN8175_c0_g2_i1:142-1209(+)